MRNYLVDYLNSLPWFKVTSTVVDNQQIVVRVTCNHWKNKDAFITFKYPDYSPHEALYSDHTEQWLIRLTGYQKITIWSQK